MKRLLLVLSFFISLFIFYTNYIDFSEKELEKYNLFINTLETNLKEDYFAVGVTLDNDESSKNNEEKLNRIIAFAYTNQYTVLSLHEKQNSDLTRTEEMSLYTPDVSKALHKFYLNKYDINNQLLLNGNYITTNLNDDNAYDHFDSIYNRYLSRYQTTFEFYSIDHLLDIDSSSFMLFIYGDVNQIRQSIESSNIVSLLDQNWENGIDVGGKQENHSITQNTYIALGVSLICIIMVSICLCYEKNKEILIRKMCGQKNGTVFKGLFLKTFTYLLLSYVSGQILCFIVFIQSFRKSATPFLFILLKYGIVSVMVMIVGYMITYIFISKKAKVRMLKQSKTNKIIVKINMALKVVIILLMLQPMITYATRSYELLQGVNYLNQHESAMRNMVGVNGISIVSEKQFFEDRLKLKKAFDDHGAYYEDFSQVNQKDDNGKKLIDYIIVNKKYLSEYSLEDVQGNTINIDQIDANTLFVPEQYKNENIQSYCDTLKCDVYIIGNDNKFFSHYPSLAYNSIANSPIILLKNSIDKHCFESSDTMMLKLNDDFTLADVKEMLTDANLNEPVNLVRSDEAFNFSWGYSLDNLISAGVLVFVYLITMIIFIYQNVYITFMERRKELSVRCMLGDAFISKYGNMMIFNNMTYFLAVCVGYFIFHIHALPLLTFMVFFLILENGIQYWLILLFEKKKIIPTLKGE